MADVAIEAARLYAVPDKQRTGHGLYMSSLFLSLWVKR